MAKHSSLVALFTLAVLVLIAGVDGTRAARGQDKPAELPRPDADGFISLFNGKDLTGWEGYQGYWSVKDGAITGDETKDNSKQTFLVLSASKADPAKFGNFELHASYRFTTKAGNSGIQFRSKIIDAKTYRVGGYQADIDGGRTYDGGIYDEASVAGNRGIMAGRGFKTTWDADNKRKNEALPGPTAQQLKDMVKGTGDWNAMILTADGNHISIKINGQLMADVFDNSPKMVKDGVIALQLHSGYTMTVQFKDIKIKLLK
jgi:hypothetical protein